jgi:hypothetical protein
MLWLSVQQYYGKALTTVASYMVTAVKDVYVEQISSEKGNIMVSFVPQRHRTPVIIDVNVITANYTFNAPLTFAIMVAFYPFVRRKKIYFEVLVILTIVHLLYVFSAEGKIVTDTMISFGYEKSSTVKSIFWEFLSQFVDIMVKRFEPFLIGAYIYFSRERM